MNYLFICSRNQWRSRTAEEIFKNNGSHVVKSAGTSPSARIGVNQSLINWADLIFVMEDKHEALLQQRFSELLNNKTVLVLDIPDEYPFMDEELIGDLKRSCASYFED